METCVKEAVDTGDIEAKIREIEELLEYLV
jgi:DNA-binding FrmR family transcriptional regulator